MPNQNMSAVLFLLLMALLFAALTMWGLAFIHDPLNTSNMTNVTAAAIATALAAYVAFFCIIGAGILWRDDVQTSAAV